MTKTMLVSMTAAIGLLFGATHSMAADRDPVPGMIGVRVSPGLQLAKTTPTGYSRFDSLNAALSLVSIERVFSDKIGEDSVYDRLRLGDYYTLTFATEAPSPESLVQYYRTVPQVDLAFATKRRMLYDEYLPCDYEFPG